MTEKQLIQMALEALEANDKLINGEDDCFGLEGAMDGYYSGCFDVEGVNKKTNEAITALRRIFEQQPAVEPVGDDKVKQLVKQCTHRDVDGNWYVDGVQLVHATCFAIDAAKRRPQPAAWVGLDRKEMLTIIDQEQADTSTGLPMFYRDQCMIIARAIETALRSKNNGS